VRSLADAQRDDLDEPGQRLADGDRDQLVQR
jgi:hypothetical protein